MEVEEYIKNGVKLEGYGPLSAVKLDRTFFSAVEAELGAIDRVLAITKGAGSLAGVLSKGEIEGCVIISKKGAVYCIESDGEYIDVFIVDVESDSEKLSPLAASIKAFVHFVKERGLIEEGVKEK
jgi:hypothetical protein